MIRENDCDCLRVVLFCKGKGADKDSYRPKSDEKQWWGRRDALARCVSSFLYGAESNSISTTTTTRKELVLFFDEDFSRLHMTIDKDNNESKIGTMAEGAFPKEETLIKLWKQAAQNLRKEVKYKGLKCVIHLDPTLSFASALSTKPNNNKTAKAGSGVTSKGNNGSSIERIDTKREVLEYIQKHCSLEFLREHRINSHPEVVLRKTNRTSLLKIWDTWTTQQSLQSSSSSSSSDAQERKGNSQQNGDPYGSSRQLMTIYKELLQFPRATSSNNDKKNQIIAGTLHESSEEFPCFRFRQEETEQQLSSKTSYNLCLFLGAVRDMTPKEGEVLQQVCEASKIPFVGVRFGRVPEFTSKILSLLSFHHANKVLGISLKRLVDAKNPLDRPSRTTPTTIVNDEPKQHSTCLNIVCTVPKSSKELSIDLKDRDHIHWRLVRVIVCSLWRSKLVSSKSSLIKHTNVLHLVFEDGFIVTLKEREFVEQLASKHQAAPSEYQILTALLHQMNRQSKEQDAPPPWMKSNKNGDWSRKKLAKHLVKSILESSPIPVTCTVGMNLFHTDGSTDKLVSRFYNHSTGVMDANEETDRGLLVVLDLVQPPVEKFSKHSGDTDDLPKAPTRKMYRQLLSASRKLQVPTTEQSLLSTWCWDLEAASIVAIQHMCYQNRVFARSCCISSSLETQEPKSSSGGKKRKRPSSGGG